MTHPLTTPAEALEAAARLNDAEADYLAACALAFSPEMTARPVLESAANRVRDVAAAIRALAAQVQPAPAPEPVSVWPSKRDVKEAIEGAIGCWRPCSGCHELNEGHPTGPFHPALRCHVGGGCSECGGIGAIWDTTDYAAMGEALSREIAPAPEPTEAQVEHLARALWDDRGEIASPYFCKDAAKNMARALLIENARIGGAK